MRSYEVVFLTDQREQKMSLERSAAFNKVGGIVWVMAPRWWRDFGQDSK